MPWHAHAHADLPIIEVSFTGALTATELATAVRETIVLMQTSGRSRLLADCSTLVGGHSIFDLYSLANAITTSDVKQPFQEAVILPDLPDSVEKVKFWETACRNRGINVRIFSDRQSALDWLLTEGAD